MIWSGKCIYLKVILCTLHWMFYILGYFNSLLREEWLLCMNQRCGDAFGRIRWLFTSHKWSADTDASSLPCSSCRTEEQNWLKTVTWLHLEKRTASWSAERSRKCFFFAFVGFRENPSALPALFSFFPWSRWHCCSLWVLPLWKQPAGVCHTADGESHMPVISYLFDSWGSRRSCSHVSPRNWDEESWTYCPELSLFL